MDIDLLSNIFYAMIRCGTPLLLVALGELICEKSGVLNLGQEGRMLFGAVIGFIVAFNSGNLWLGVLLAMAAGMLLSALFALVALVFNANQVATGLALTIFGVGLSSFVGARSEEHTSELQSLMRISYDVFCLKKKTTYTSILA